MNSSTETVPGPWISSIKSPPITDVVWKKSYFLKSHIIDYSSSNFFCFKIEFRIENQSFSKFFWKNCKLNFFLGLCDQKLCNETFSPSSQSTRITDVNLVLSPTAIRHIRTIPTKLTIIWSNNIKQIWVKSWDILHSY